MKNLLQFLIIVFFIITIDLYAQLAPREAIKAMSRGINMGNTLEPPGGEGTWGNPPAVETNFDDYKDAGFTCVRIPITWDKHVSASSPYLINAAWLTRIEQIVDWGLKRKLLIIINAHHEDWIKKSYTAQNTARFDSIWSQIASRFKNKSDSLLFEIINEPNELTADQVNQLNDRVLKIIRKTNPTRIVLFSGNNWSNSDELVVAAVPQDNYLIGYYHSYDPYPFGLKGTGTYGSDADINATRQKFDQVASWSAKNNIPVVISEYGFMNNCEYNSRMCAYATDVDQALAHNVGAIAWEDGGDFKFYNRNDRTWSEIKDIIISTYNESPNKMRINTCSDTLIQISWNNRTSENDSIIIERGVNNSNFSFLKKVSPAASQFIDTDVRIGTTYYYRLRTVLKDSIELMSYPVRITDTVVTRSPYKGIPIAIPGIFDAENFDNGMEGVSYHDSDPMNNGGTYRLGPGVDIYGTGTKIYVGDVAPGEWMEYTITVKDEADYSISANMGAVTAGGEFVLEFQNGTTNPFTAAATGKLTTFNVITNTFHLYAGEQIMRLKITKTPEFSVNNFKFAIVTAVEPEHRPDNFYLYDSYPNPFNPSTTFEFNLPSSTFITLKIFDVVGREISTILSGDYEAGKHTMLWDASNLPGGVYFYKLQAGKFSQTKKLVLLK